VAAQLANASRASNGIRQQAGMAMAPLRNVATDRCTVPERGDLRLFRVPVTGGKEVVGGFAVLEVAWMDEVLQVARHWEWPSSRDSPKDRSWSRQRIGCMASCAGA